LREFSLNRYYRFISHFSEAVEPFLSLDLRAAQIPDSVRKLKFLRRELSLAPVPSRARLPWSSLIAITATALALMVTGSNSPARAKNATNRLTTPTPFVPRQVAPAPKSIWPVEKTPAYQVYSNGLQIRTEYLTESAMRHYATWSRADLTKDAAESTRPAGIVFHTTESLMLPMEAGQTHSLLRTREGVLDYIRNGHLYNYVIDRFGQVFRMVPDGEVAFHSGNSLWADDHHIYVDLNDSFLGVAFEARTEPSFAPDAAQIRSGRMLTDFLRSQFSIPAANCVTHAQVSVNPSNMEIGYHTDWGASFPFGEFGLPDGYATALPAVELFGFQYNQFFLNAIGGKPWAGLLSAEGNVTREAGARKISPAVYRKILQKKYQAIRSQKHESTDRDRT